MIFLKYKLFYHFLMRNFKIFLSIHIYNICDQNKNKNDSVCNEEDLIYEE